MGERGGAGADPAIGGSGGDGRGRLERKLRQFVAALDTGTVTTPGERDYLQRLLREAAAAIGEARRAMEGGRRLFRDPGGTCGCEDCRALRAIDRALARLERGDI